MNNRLDCCIVKDLLPGYVDNVTSPETNRQIEEHLASCEECRKDYEAMKEPEKHFEETRQINYLKKIRRVVASVIAVAVVACALIVARVYYATSDSPAAFAYHVQEMNGQLYVQAEALDPGMDIREGNMSAVEGKADLKIQVGKGTPFSSHEQTWSIPQGTKTITLNGMTIYDEGTIVSREASRAFALKTPYVGNASAVSAFLWETGVHYEKFELFTDSQPYGMTVYVKHTPKEQKAALCLACIENLSYITFQEEGNETTYDLAYFKENCQLDLKELGKTPVGLQKILDALE